MNHEDLHPDCKFCPHPCKNCNKSCFDGKCFFCFPERFIPCTRCTQLTWDGDAEKCDCSYMLTDEEVQEYLGKK